MNLNGLRSKAEKLIEILRENPYTTPPPFEKLLGDLSGAFSRRINIQHRLVYQIIDDEKVVSVHPETASFGPRRRSRSFSILEIARYASG
ncbi:MAG: Txe/YoeB family addiction module toxin [Deltaproteobacteria bacterium]|nr:Txe/YoeB family addiction module toxin [Deltaproteobacteria bacterium]